MNNQSHPSDGYKRQIHGQTQGIGLPFPGELRNQINDYVVANVSNDGDEDYSGYMLSSKEVYDEASSMILKKLNQILTEVETAFQQETGMYLDIRKPTKLGDAGAITVGLPKSYFRRTTRWPQYTQPLLAQYPHLPAGPLTPLLYIPCPGLIFELYDDPNWKRLVRTADPRIYDRTCNKEFVSNVAQFCSELTYVVRERSSRPCDSDGPADTILGTSVTAPNSAGSLKANVLVFKWGRFDVRRNVWYGIDGTVDVERGLVDRFASLPDFWWRCEIFQDNGAVVDISDHDNPRQLVEGNFSGRACTLGIILTKIEERTVHTYWDENERFQIVQTNVYSKDLRGQRRGN